MNKALFRFYGELNDFLPRNKKQQLIPFLFKDPPAVKDIIESLGIPHTEVELITVNSQPVSFSYKPDNSDYISVYPFFRTLDVTGISQVKEQLPEKTEFIVDVNMGQLAKYLRLMGFDTYYRNDLDDKEIAEISSSEDRIVLTRDIGLLKRKIIRYGYWVRSTSTLEQLKEVIERYKLENMINPFNKCLECNSRIEKVDKKDVFELVPEKSRAFFNDYYKCTSCEKVFWKGSHYENMLASLSELIPAYNNP